MRVSWATWKPYSQWDHGPRILNKALVLHTAVTTADDIGILPSPDEGIGAHFYLQKDGGLIQHVDTSRVCWHAAGANPFSVSLESQDTGSSPDPGPWTQAQLDTIDRLARLLKCPAKTLKETASDGLGYHRLYDSWNPNVHSCPGDDKVNQFQGIIDRLKGDDMTKDEHDLLVQAAADAGRAAGFVNQLAKRHGIDPDVKGGIDNLARIVAQQVRKDLGVSPDGTGTKDTPVPATMPGI